MEETKGQVAVDASNRRRDTVVVRYSDRLYEVGKDIQTALVASEFGRDMTDAYYDSNVYHALMRGALVYMGERHIHSLVLGLPMNHFENPERVAKLEKAYTGVINLAPGLTVTIDRAVVHPQPFGGYLSLGNDLEGINKALEEYPNCGLSDIKSVNELAKLNILIVDPGEYTLDWLMMTPTGAAQRASSAAGDAGRHRVLRVVHGMIAEKLKAPLGVTFMSDIDKALREKTRLRVRVQAFDLQSDEFQKAIMQAVEDPVRQMLEGLRGAEDRVDLVAVLGGSPLEIANAIRIAKPWLPVYCPSNGVGQQSSMFANVRGFQEWSEALAPAQIAA